VIPGPQQLQEISRLREGSLQEVSFPVLLLAHAVRERTLVLDLERGPLRKTVVIEDGVPVDCRSNLVHETLGRYLAGTGRLTDEQANESWREAVSRGLPVGHVLLDKGLVTPMELFRLLQQNLGKKLLDLFTWRDGRFRQGFDVPKVDSPLKVNVPQLVVMGITRLTPQEEVNAAVVPLVGQILALHPAPHFPLDEVRLTAHQARVLSPLRRGCRIDELIAESGLPPDEISRLVYALAVLGTVAPADQLPAAPPAPSAPAPRVPAPPAAAPEPAPAPPKPASTFAPDPAEAERLGNQLMHAYLSHRGQDAYDLLGLPENAEPARIQERYLDFATRFHPARFEGDLMRPFADKARELFLAAARAYAELADAQQRQTLRFRRQTLREQAAAPPPPDFSIKTDLLDADVQYRKGKQLLEAGQFRPALQVLEFAADCDPGNGQYRAELAWVRYKLNPTFAGQQSLAELEEAQRVDAKCGLAAYYAGLIHAALGSAEEAERELRRALKLMAPDRRPIEALKELQKKHKR